jgi:hypothetical protein
VSDTQSPPEIPWSPEHIAALRRDIAEMKPMGRNETALVLALCDTVDALREGSEETGRLIQANQELGAALAEARGELETLRGIAKHLARELQAIYGETPETEQPEETQT